MTEKTIVEAVEDAEIAKQQWRDIKDKHGSPAPSLANAVIAIRALDIVCRYDLFHQTVLIEYRGVTEPMQFFVGELTNNTLAAIRSLINNTFKFDVGEARTAAAVLEIAQASAFDPVLDYLAEVEGRWDGTGRIDKWLINYCGADDTPFNRAIGRMHLIASVRRARQPGVKYDNILTMESAEGRNKSKLVEVLAGRDNFSDQTILGARDKEAQELMAGVWLYEIADLTGISKAEVDRIKAFASRTTDRARPAFGRVVEKRPRRCTLWGTTNDKQYLKSQTGNRRWLPVKVGRIDVDAVVRDRDQLWGEAADAESAGESITLDEKLWGTAAEEQEERRLRDPWEDVLANIPETIDVGDPAGPMQIIHRTKDGSSNQERVATADLLTYVLGVPVAQQTSSHGQRLATIMERNGWQRPDKNGPLWIGSGKERRKARGYWRPVEGELALATREEAPGERGDGGGR
jgi:predicted P-loop ATPase